MDIRPFRIAVADDVIADLHRRLDATRWPDALDDADGAYGLDPGVVRAWCERWRKFDWRANEARLNRFDQFTAPIDGIDFHLVHVKSGRADAVPLLLVNGWPSTFAEYSRIIAQLAESGFDVVIPSLPGYGFSSQPTEPGWNATRTARAMAALMTALGYDRFGIHGSDMGAGVMLALAAQVPERLIALHSVNVYWAYPPPDDPGKEEKAWLEKGQKWQMAEGGYAMIQASKPQTLAPGLNDSPAGLAAWVLEKWQTWSDGGLDAFDPDDVLTNLTIYWATGTIGSSVRLYAEGGRDPEAKAMTKRHETPAGVLVLPHDILPAPRAWGERWLNVRRWTEATRGGHFPALEAGDLVVGELRALFDRELADPPAERPHQLANAV